MKSTKASLLCLLFLIVSMSSSYAGNKKNITVEIEAGAGEINLSNVKASVVPGTNINPTNIQSKSANNASFQGGGAIGYEFEHLPFSVALQYLYTGMAKLTDSNYNNATTADPFVTRVHSNALFANLTWRVFQSHHWGLFIGGGVGVALDVADTTYTQVNNGTNTITLNKNDDTVCFAAQGNAGISYSIANIVVLSLLYRYSYLGKPDIGNYGNSYAPNITNLSFHSNSLTNQAGILRFTYYFYRSDVL